jgi:hypothetical protein
LKNTRPYHPPVFIALLLLALGCAEGPRSIGQEASENPEPNPGKAATTRLVSPEFKQYWYAGVAEVSSYELQQARYGELRKGEATLIFVTEPFDPVKQVKADRQGPSTTSVLKLNRVRKFLTGVYPYSIMTSIFYPVSLQSHALKITTSVQEWCGHVYAQLNNRGAFEVDSRSYFESEADQSLSLEKNILEDELWTLLRIDPGEIPTGTLELIPSLEYLRLKHHPIKSYTAHITLSRGGSQGGELTLTYPKLNRTLRIQFATAFPHRIEGWTETYPSGDGELTSTARLKRTIRSPYWQKNRNSDTPLRDSLGLSMP